MLGERNACAVLCIFPFLIVAALACAPGEFQQGICRSCPQGTYQPFDNFKGPSCTDCEVGKTQAATGAASCNVCSAGKFMDIVKSTATDCKNCLAGTFQNQAGQETCRQCLPGSFQPNPGATSCTSCTAGKFQNITAATTPCTDCPAGRFQDLTGQASCKICDAGKYQTAPGATTCISCPVGRYQDIIGATTVCKACETGKFQDVIAQGTCKICETGKFQGATGQTNCSICTVGKFQDVPGSSDCKNCQAGKYQDVTGQTDCKSCEAGKYQGSSSSSTCITCATGFWSSDIGRVSACTSAWTSCAAGFYVKTAPTASNDRICDRCIGGFTSSSNQLSCTPYSTCAAGFEEVNAPTPSTDRTCAVCPSGKFSTTTNSKCSTWTVCGPGTDGSSSPGTTTSDRVCTRCILGRYSNADTGLTCVPWSSTCVAGQYEMVSPDTSTDRLCQLCPAGKFSDQGNVQTCKSCDGITSFQDQPGETSCKPLTMCPPGTGEGLPGASPTSDRNCVFCSLGQTFSPGNFVPCTPVTVCKAGEQETQAPTLSTDRICAPCPAETYNPTAGSGVCQPVSRCVGNQLQTKEFTPTSDRVCTVTDFCKDGRFGDTQNSCTCPGGSTCSECLQQPGSSDGLVLIQDGGQPKVSASIDDRNPIVQIPAGQDPLNGCRALCDANTNCTSFFVYVSGPSRGSCFMKRSYSTTRGFDYIAGGVFYAMPLCAKCAFGFYPAERSCNPQNALPEVTSRKPAKLRMPVNIVPNTVILNVLAISPDGFGPISYSLSGPSDMDNVVIDRSSGVIRATDSFRRSSSGTFTVTAVDIRSTCSRYTDRGVLITTAGGCSTSFSFTIDAVSFLSCPVDIDQYLSPARTSAIVSWTPPTIPQFPDIRIDSNYPNASYHLFEIGRYQVYYSTPELDVGGAANCTFSVRVQYGFRFNTDSIGHVSSGQTLLDFLVDGDGVTKGGAKVPSFTGDVLGQGLAIGIFSPPEKPFSLFLRPGFKAQLFIQLQWCESGTFPQDAVVVPSPAQIEIVGLFGRSQLPFVDGGSGYIGDGSCFRITASSATIVENLSFVSLNINFSPKTSPRKRRTAGVLSFYSPVSPNLVVFQYSRTDGTPITSDPGSMVTLEDRIPPEWLGCPSSPIRVTAAPGQDRANVSWNIPVAVDNVAVLRTTNNSSPGSFFSIIDSPHTVTYTAYDANQAGVCEFVIIVDYQPVGREFSDIIVDKFPSAVSTVSVLDLTVLTQYLTSTSDTIMDTFTVDVGNYTQLKFRFRADIGDTIAVRTRDTAIFGQIDVDLRWSVPGVADLNSEIPISSDVIALFEFEGLSIDRSGNFKESNPSKVSNLNRFQTAEVTLDPILGLLRVRGQSAPFHYGFSFTSFNVILQYPTGRVLTAPLTYKKDSGSQVGIRYFFSNSANNQTVAQRLGFLALLDTERPVFQTCPSNIAVNSAPGRNFQVVSWPEPIASDNRGAPTVTKTHTSNSTFLVKPFGDVGHLVIYTAVDAFGNSATCSFYVTVSDREAPRLTCPAAKTYILLNGTSQFTVPSRDLTPAVTDNYQTSGFVFAYPSSLTYGVGNYSARVAVTDSWKNTASCNVQVFILDKEPPVLVCPDLNSIPEEIGTGGAIVKWPSIIVTDNDRALDPVSTHEQGFFPIGVTNVTVTAPDASGNIGSCSFSVIVVPVAQKSTTTDKTVISGAAGGAGGLFVILLVVLFLLYRARQAAKRPQNWEEIFALMENLKNESEEDGPVIPREIARSSVRIIAELGKGAFGLVSKGILQESLSVPGYLVAVKSLLPGSAGSDRQELLEEAAVMAQFKCPYVVQLIGVVTIGKPLLVVLEFMEMGDLKSYLEKNFIDEETKLLFAGDCAEGLHHIHTKGFLHRDIAARNVLLSSECRCKISDFGLAREQIDDTYYRSKGGNLPVRWSSPEALEERKFNEATEIWSFGILMYEIWTKAELPYKGWHNQKVWVQVANGYRLPRPDGCDKEVFDLMLKCWEHDQSDRATFPEAIEFLRKRLKEMRGDVDEEEYIHINEEEELVERRSTLSKLFQSLLRRSGKKQKEVANVKSAGPVDAHAEMMKNYASLNRKRDKSISGTATYVPKMAQNPSFEEDIELEERDTNGRRANENSVLYDMGDIKESANEKKKPVNENSVLYDMGDIKETGMGNSRPVNENSVLYDMGDIRETGLNGLGDRNDSMSSNDFGFGGDDEGSSASTPAKTPTKQKNRFMNSSTIQEEREEDEAGEDVPLTANVNFRKGPSPRTMSLMMEMEDEEDVHGDIYDNTGMTDL